MNNTLTLYPHGHKSPGEKERRINQVFPKSAVFTEPLSSSLAGTPLQRPSRKAVSEL